VAGVVLLRSPEAARDRVEPAEGGKLQFPTALVLTAVSASLGSAQRAGSEESLAVERDPAVVVAVGRYTKVGIGAASEDLGPVERTE